MESDAKRGKLIVFSAPSGAGKSTLVQHLLENINSLSLSVSVTTRKSRDYEKESVHYHFITEKKFHSMVTNNQLLEWEEVYQGVFYGTPISEIDRIWKAGQHVIFDMDVVGALNVKKRYRKATLTVFVTPPSIEELEKRLRSRNTENDYFIKKRYEKAKTEMRFKDQFDVVLSNHDLEQAKNDALLLVQRFLNQTNSVNE